MINLLTNLFSKLTAIHPRTYLETAPPKSQFPYVVFSLPTSDESDYREDFILEIDIWDNKPLDTTMVETLTDNIDKALNRSFVNTTDFQYSAYRMNRLMLPDPDENIRRRQLRYQIKYYDKQQ